jgi:hypothetical protein
VLAVDARTGRACPIGGRHFDAFEPVSTVGCVNAGGRRRNR